jgi:homoserine dehydrogenase
MHVKKDIVLAGFGKVGRQFVRVLAGQHSSIIDRYGLDIRLVAVVGRSGGLYNAQGLDLDLLGSMAVGSNSLSTLNGLWSEQMGGITGIIAAKADILVDATPTDVHSGEPGSSYFRAAIEQGMDIVAFTKGPLVKNYSALMQLAKDHGSVIKAAGATAAALPTLDIGMYCYAGDTIEQFEGILNGTTNYILSRMTQDGLAFEEALAEAVTAGVAEANPRLDVEGWDTASKAVILASSLLNESVQIGDVAVRGIQNVTVQDIKSATANGQVIKLIAKAIRTPQGVKLTVGPECIPVTNPLAHVGGAAKGIRFIGKKMGEIMVTGGRSDLTGTAAAGLKDLINLACEKYGCSRRNV